MRRSRAVSTSALIGAAIGGWIAGRELTRDADGQPGSSPMSWTDSLYSAHTVHLRGDVSAVARSRLAANVAAGPAILVVLDSIDLRRCGDLGRQLRELQRAVAKRLPVLVATGGTPRREVDVFLRSERLLLQAVDALGAGDLFESGSAVPTPAAVWLDPDLRYAIGVGHIPRYPYVRSRSFAEELSQLSGVHGKDEP